MGSKESASIEPVDPPFIARPALLQEEGIVQSSSYSDTNSKEMDLNSKEGERVFT